jgi:hypothetical protein
LLLLLAQAPLEQLSAVYRVLTGQPLPLEWEDARPPQATTARSESGAKGGAAYLFRWTGRDWKVVFEGGEPFYLLDTLGARYVDYLLHHPNEPISAFDLEIEITPEKAEARSENSIQPESDPRALKEYRRELGRLQTEREKAQAVGDREGVGALDQDIAAYEAALGGSTAPDTGQRAYDNVRQALRGLSVYLGKKGSAERAFAEHIRTYLSIGFECAYLPPEGNDWE